ALMAGASDPVMKAPRRGLARVRARSFSRPVGRSAPARTERTRHREGPRPMLDKLSRRQFVQDGAVTAAALAAGLASAPIVRAGNPTGADTSKILNYNADMEY